MRILIVLFCWLTASAGLAVETPDEARSPRQWEVVRRECRTSISRQEITLFRNGTLRLKSSDEQGDEMRLAELEPEEVEAYIRRFEGEDLSEVEEGRDEVLGSWVERCGLFLELPGQPGKRFFFGRFDSLPLALARLNAIVDDLLDQVDELAPEGGLPRDYFPEPGDILLRPDGRRFQVVGLTSDRKGVELTGIDEPLTIFVAIEALRDQFSALAERRSFP